MSLRQLRARLDRLEQAAGPPIGQDRALDRKRLDKLRMCALRLTPMEKIDYDRLRALFADETRERNRLCQLGLIPFEGKKWTEAEQQEYEELKRRYPPDPDDPLRPALEAMGCTAWKEAEENNWKY